MIIIMRLNAVRGSVKYAGWFRWKCRKKKTNQNFHGSPSARQCRTINFLDFAEGHRWKSFEIKTTTTPSQMAFNATKKCTLRIRKKTKKEKLERCLENKNKKKWISLASEIRSSGKHSIFSIIWKRKGTGVKTTLESTLSTNTKLSRVGRVTLGKFIKRGRTIFTTLHRKLFPEDFRVPCNGKSLCL